MEPVVIGRSDLGEGLLDPGAIPPRGRVLLGGGQPVVFIVPLMAGDARGVVEQIEAASSEPHDMFEWRVDYLDVLAGLSGEELSDQAREEISRSAAEILGTSDVPVLATVRTAAQGGNAEVSTPIYGQIIELLAGCGMDAVDVEMAPAAPALTEKVHAAGAKVVMSFHDFEVTPESEIMRELLETMAVLGADVVKLAVLANSERDALNVELVQRWASEYVSAPSIVLAMGECGRQTRATRPEDGGVASFVAVSGRESAPGQWGARELAERLGRS